jgi:hypothetical protein
MCFIRLVLIDTCGHFIWYWMVFLQIKLHTGFIRLWYGYSVPSQTIQRMGFFWSSFVGCIKFECPIILQCNLFFDWLLYKYILSHSEVNNLILNLIICCFKCLMVEKYVRNISSHVLRVKQLVSHFLNGRLYHEINTKVKPDILMWNA